jgi:hypothetical protein
MSPNQQKQSTFFKQRVQDDEWEKAADELFGLKNEDGEPYHFDTESRRDWLYGHSGGSAEYVRALKPIWEHPYFHPFDNPYNIGLVFRSEVYTLVRFSTTLPRTFRIISRKFPRLTTIRIHKIAEGVQKVLHALNNDEVVLTWIYQGLT